MFSPRKKVWGLLTVLLGAMAVGCVPPDDTGLLEGDAPIIEAVAIEGAGAASPAGVPAVAEQNLELESSAQALEAAAANTPTITSFSPSSGSPGQQITVNGTNFNRDRFGTLWAGAPPYKVRFKSSASSGNVVQLTNAAFTVLSATQLKVTIPADAITDKVRLTQTAPGQFDVFHLSPTTFTVTPPTTVRFTNNSQYALVSITSGGAQALPAGVAALPGQQVEVRLATGGTFLFQVGLGNLSGGQPNPFFIFNRTVTVATGTTATTAFAPMTLGQVMTIGSAGSTTWRSDVFFDANLLPHQWRLNMSLNGSWSLFFDSNLSAQGVASPTFWPSMTSATANGPTVTFKLNANITGGQLPFPYGSFFIKVGGQVRQFTRQ